MSDPNFEVPPPPPATDPESGSKALRPVKLRLPAIVLFVIGLLVVVGGITKFITGGVATGAGLACLGVIFFALSFIPLPEPAPDAEKLSLGQRLAGIFYEPSRVFRSLRSYPNWVAPFLIISLLTAIYTAAFAQRLTPDRIVNYTIDKVVESGFAPADLMERSRQEQLAAAKSVGGRVGEGVGKFVTTFVFSGLIAALYLLGVLVFGGRINFWQSLAVTFWASLPVVVVHKIVSLIILFVKNPDDIHPILGQETLVQDNLGVLFNPATNPVLFVAGTAIGVLSFYGLWLKAKGLQNGGTKVSSTAAWASAIFLWVLGLIIGMIFATLFSSFMS